MEDVFIICSYSDFTKNTSNTEVTDNIKEAYYLASLRKNENKYDTVWIEVWNKSGMFGKFEEKDFMEEMYE